MNIQFGALILTCGLLAGCDSAKPSASSRSTTTTTTTTRTDTGSPPATDADTTRRKGVEVNAPGVNVKVDQDGTSVKAPGTDVDIKKDK